MSQNKQSVYFLHGLESSGNGTKGQFFAERFPHIISADYTGDLATRLSQLKKLCEEDRDVILIGSSFGGLMASCFSATNRERVKRLILMAPALNFAAYAPPARPIDVPTLLLIGKHDDITPIDPVLALAQKTFSNLTVWICDDDHMLHRYFAQLDWTNMLDPTKDFSSLDAPHKA